MVFAVVDGRQPGYSVGITLGDLTDILMSYGVVNAAACDGGSSSILYYDGKIINTPSTPMKTTGRYLPNAVVVKTAGTQCPGHLLLPDSSILSSRAQRGEDFAIEAPEQKRSFVAVAPQDDKPQTRSQDDTLPLSS
jgi:hypothetical protein